VVLQRRQVDRELLGVGHDVLDGLQLGHVVARLRRHAQALVVGRQAGRLVALDGLLHAAFAPVVGGQGQLPVVEHAVELLQVVQRGAGGGQHVAPVIAEHVLLEVEGLAGGRHELPHAGGLGRGDGMRVEGAFDEGQQASSVGMWRFWISETTW
jgi:hypothetical protein